MGLYGSPDLTNKEVKQDMPKKPFYKRWWFIVVIVIIFIGVIGGSGEEKTGNEEIPEFFKTGETVETKLLKASITGIEKPSGNSFNKPADGKEFVLLHLTIENVSTEELNISSILSFSAYVDDESINESLSAQIAKEGENTVNGTIAADKKLRGTLGYEVPNNWRQIEIHFKPDLASSTTIKWIIKNE